MELAFGARLPGSTHLQLQGSTQQRLGQRSSPPEHPTKKGGCHYHGALPVLPRANLYALASPTRTYSLQVPRSPTPGDIYHTKLMGTHSDLLLPPRSKIGCHPADSDQATSNTDPDKARRAQTRCASRKARSDQQHTDPEPHNNDNTPRSIGYPVKILIPSRRPLQTATRSAGHSDLETQTDLSTKAATRPAI